VAIDARNLDFATIKVSAVTGLAAGRSTLVDHITVKVFGRGIQPRTRM
jgi:hypothetical protein